ncbi:MAG: hypothetical protein H0T46_30310 [Deltaproteobacteria bacterium]|nr:hypothetical protein [Deltaproteobacteria bacterium]
MKPWLVRAAVILGAATLVGCPTKKWVIEPAQVPPVAKDSNIRRVITVSASREPQVMVERKGGGGWEPATPMEPLTWPGSGRYQIDAHQQLGRVSISQSCGSGCIECIPPRDGREFIRIDRADTVHVP